MRYFKSFLLLFIIIFCLTSCAERTIQILDKNNKVVGECIAGYDWHFYGLQDSIDYMLYQCAKDSIKKGLTVSDLSLLNKDFSLPDPPKGKTWNKKLAMEQFKLGAITERKLGYILAAIEYKFHLKEREALKQLSEGKITREKFEELVKKAKYDWLGE